MGEIPTRRDCVFVALILKDLAQTLERRGDDRAADWLNGRAQDLLAGETSAIDGIERARAADILRISS